MKSLPFSERLLKYIPALAMGLGAFLATFDVTAVSLALPAIRETYFVLVGDSIWVMSAYSLAFTICLLAAGAISDRHGNRNALALGAFLFLAASILCAAAPSFTTLITGRLVQGIGAAFIVCGGYALMSKLYTEKADRVKAFAIMGTVGGSALALGPGLGGIISSVLGWEWIFYINVPVCLFIMLGAYCTKEEIQEPVSDRFDYLGVVLFGLLLLCVTWTLMHGTELGPWELNRALTGCAIAVLLGMFIWAEKRAPSPAIDLSLFKEPAFLGLAFVPLCLAISYWSLIVYIPLFLEVVFSQSIQNISYILLLFTLPMFLVPYLVTDLATKLSEQAFFSLGLLIVAVGGFCMAAGAYLGSYVVSGAGMIVAGAGAAAMQTQVTGALIASAPQSQTGAVSAILTALRQGGFALGIACLSLVLNEAPALPGTSAGNYTVLFLCCAGVAAVGSVAVFLLLPAGEPKILREN